MNMRFGPTLARPLLLAVACASGYFSLPTVTAADNISKSASRQFPQNRASSVTRHLAKAATPSPVPQVRLSTGDVVSGSVTKTPLRSVRKISRKIDTLVNAQLKTNRITPARLANDEVFLRRAYLDIVGRIPSLEETDAFLSSKNKQKRSHLIDGLLDSYGYVSRQYNFWADLLRAKSKLRNVEGQPYIDFIKDSLSANQPYDEFVRELLSASGPNLRRGNGAVGYYLRDANMPEDNMSNTVRIFLGTRLECAQCHDHPFDIWTQRDYYEMVAFTGGIQYRTQDVDSEHADEIKRLYRSKDLPQDERAALRKILDPMSYQISGSGSGLARLPEDYEMGNGHPHDIITAKTMFEKKSLVDAKIPVMGKRQAKSMARVNKKFPQRIPNAPEIGSRDAYAEWMTAPDNPRFATVIANRLWKQAMGLGLVEPVDSFMEDTYASNEELMTYLSQVMIDLGFDLKQFLRCIYNSNVYQRVGDSAEVTEPDTHNFNGPLVRRMQAEQIWDSLLSLAVANIDKRSTDLKGLQYIPGVDMYEGYEKLRELDVDELTTLSHALMNRRKGNKDAMMDAMTDVFETDGAEKSNDTKTRLGQFPAQMAKLNRQLESAKANRNKAATARILKARKGLSAYARQLRSAAELKRASELPSPAKPGHFLREFGQSDREQIDNANKEPAVPQSLSLMNGLVEKTITRSEHSVLMQNIQAHDDPKAKVVTAYRTMLIRHPQPAELKMWASAIENDGKPATSDLIWTLANSVEFLFVR